MFTNVYAPNPNEFLLEMPHFKLELSFVAAGPDVSHSE